MIDALKALPSRDGPPPPFPPPHAAFVLITFWNVPSLTAPFLPRWFVVGIILLQAVPKPHVYMFCRRQCSACLDSAGDADCNCKVANRDAHAAEACIVYYMVYHGAAAFYICRILVGVLVFVAVKGVCLYNLNFPHEHTRTGVASGCKWQVLGIDKV